ADHASDTALRVLGDQADRKSARLAGPGRMAEPFPSGFRARREPGPVQKIGDRADVGKPHRSYRVSHFAPPRTPRGNARKSCAGNVSALRARVQRAGRKWAWILSARAWLTPSTLTRSATEARDTPRAD